jgi:hypothetical protein
VQADEVHTAKAFEELNSATWAAVKGPAIAPVWQSPDWQVWPAEAMVASNKLASKQILALMVFPSFRLGLPVDAETSFPWGRGYLFPLHQATAHYELDTVSSTSPFGLAPPIAGFGSIPQGECRVEDELRSAFGL